MLCVSLMFESMLSAHGTQNGRSSMTVIDLLLLLLIAGVCGSIGRAIGGYSHGGCLVSIALGFIGALLGMWLARPAGLYEPLPGVGGGTTLSGVWAIVGSGPLGPRLGPLSRPRAGSAP